MTDDTTLHVHLGDEIKRGPRNYRDNSTKELLETLESLSALMPKGDYWHGSIASMIEEVQKLVAAERDGRHEQGTDGTFLNAVKDVTDRVSRRIATLVEKQGTILAIAARLDAFDARLNGIEDQRKDLSPMEAMRIELEENKIDAMRGVSAEQAAAAREEAKRLKMETQCGSKADGSSDPERFARYSSCDKKAKVVIDGVKLCGIHAQPTVRDAKSRIEHLSTEWGRYGHRNHSAAKAKENAVEIETITVQKIEPIKKALKEAGKTGSIITVEFPSEDEATEIAAKRVAEKRNTKG